MRVCRVCGVDKASDLFYPATRVCKACKLEQLRVAYQSDPEKYRARVRKYVERNPEKIAAGRRKHNASPRRAASSRRGNIKKHGLTELEYDELFVSQGEACAVCKSPNPGRWWCIDHDHDCCPGTHSCGRCVRGILCWHCNVGIGHFRDDVGVLYAAIAYLQIGGGVRVAEEGPA